MSKVISQKILVLEQSNSYPLIKAHNTHINNNYQKPKEIVSKIICIYLSEVILPKMSHA